MKRSAVLLAAAALALAGAAGASAAPYTVVTYNVGLLKVFGSDLVPIVDARAKAAPAAIAKLAADTGASIIQLEEIWRDPYAKAIAEAAAPLGYTAVVPNAHSIVGLTSGLLLLVKAPLTVEDWSFTAFTTTTLTDSFARKGVLQATLKDTATGAEIALVSTHTVAVDTVNGVPKDAAQVKSITGEVAAIRAAVKARSRDGELPVILLGDFNVGPGYADDVYRSIAASTALVESGAVLDPSRTWVTWDPANPLVKFGGYPGEPAAKIDHVFLQDGRGAAWTVKDARVLMQEPVPGLSLVPKGAKDAVPAPLSDHYAWMAGVELLP